VLAFAAPFGSALGIPLGEFNVTPTEGVVGVVAVAWLVATLSGRFNGRAEFAVMRHASRTGQTWGDDSATPARWSITLWLLVAFVVLNVAGISQALATGAAIKEVLRWFQVLTVVVVAMALLRRQVDVKRLVALLLIAGAAEALIGAFQFFTRTGPPSFAVGQFLRAHGTFGQPNPFAGYLGMVLPLAIALLLFWALPRSRAGGDQRRALLWVAFAGGSASLMTLGLAMSLSRGAWLGILVGLSIIAAIASRRALAVLIAGIALASLMAFLGAVDVLPAPVTARVTSITQSFAIYDVTGIRPNQANFAVIERLAHWQAAWSMFHDGLLFGIGPGQYVFRYAEYQLPFWDDPLGHAHNFYLHVAAELGSIGLAIYLLIVGSLIVRAVGILRRSAPGSFSRALALGCLGIIIGSSVHNGFDNLYVQGMNVHMALIFGMLLSYPRWHQN
ncbi:MAG TPA: O-antigen ligase family protein, partial [Chloroflexota bacterium]|nr:O-antigen ligase family protein [Chloroflexota bacterium]